MPFLPPRRRKTPSSTTTPEHQFEASTEPLSAESVDVDPDAPTGWVYYEARPARGGFELVPTFEDAWAEAKALEAEILPDADRLADLLDGIIVRLTDWTDDPNGYVSSEVLTDLLADATLARLSIPKEHK